MSHQPLPSLSSWDVCRALSAGRFSVTRTHGSHLILSDGVRTVTVAHPQKDVHEQTLWLILRQSGLSKVEFGKLLRRK